MNATGFEGRGRLRIVACGWAAMLLVIGPLSPEVRSQSADQLTKGSAAAATAISKAYEKTKTAKSIAEYSEIVQLCQQAQAVNLSESSTDYVQRLLAWAFNRRGEAYAEQAATLMRQGKKEDSEQLDAKALADFEAAVKNDTSRWKAIHNRGVSYALAGEYEKAIGDFDRTIELKPDYVNVWFNRAEIRYEQGKYEESVADYNQVLRLDEEDAGALTSRGHAYFQLRRFRQALADYEQAVQILGDDANSYANRGDAHQNLGEWEKAAADYRQAIKLDPQLSRAHHSSAWLMATCPKDQIRDAESAVEAAEKAIDLEGEDQHQCLDILAAAYANAGRFTEAQQVQRRAIDAAPEGEAERLRRRLKLYEAETPFRQGEQSIASRPAANPSR